MKSFAAKLVLMAVMVASDASLVLYGFAQFTSKNVEPHWNGVQNIARSINGSNPSVGKR